MRQDRTKAGKKTLQRSQTAENPRVAKWKSERRGWQLSNCRETDSCHMKTDIKTSGWKKWRRMGRFCQKKTFTAICTWPRNAHKLPERRGWQLSKCGETRLLSDEITETFRPRYTVLAPPLSKHLNRNKLVIEIVLSYSTPLLLATCERAAVRGGHLELGDFSYLLCNSWDMKGYEEKKI